MTAYRQLCHENEEKFELLLLHTEVRWLLKGKCLQRFYDLDDSVIDFFKFKLLDEKKLNEVNIKLQGTKMCLIKAKGIIMAFISKLDFYKNCLLREDLNQFPSLKAVKKNQIDDSCLSDTDLDCYSSHFQAFKEKLLIRFKDIKELKIPE
ncbi:general transcription factor II-I repeat domain-containing protein 2B-like [Clavelina lepadiformis]|uniref:general transcription factor II-I repeat domain-containing protein 2B-like n=1 Tax=Clavelina lepadiformis TaxID=159417 RepID=UPI00404302FC